MFSDLIPPRAPAYVGKLESLRDKTVLVRVEYGAGDSIILMRYFPILRKHCAKLVIEARDGMEGLYRVYFPEYEVVRYQSKIHRDVVQVPLMSLPRLLGPVIGWDPPTQLDPPSRFVREHRDGIGIVPDCLVAPGGVTWPGNNRAEKNPAPEMIATLEAEFGPFVSLRHADLNHCTWEQTAEIVAGLELVISVDSGPAHLAASLGIETWVLHRHEVDWRWSSPPWYSGVAQVFQQKQPGAWDEVFCDVQAALRLRA
jgi:hypothetical protein